MDFPLDFVRRSFPALEPSLEPEHGMGSRIFFDNGAGSQVPARVVDAVTEHLTRRNVQRGGRYPLSIQVDETIQEARETLAVFVNTEDSGEICLGLNATSFIVQVSRGFGELLEKGDEVVLTELDHEANITPWLELEKRGIRVKFWPVRPGGVLEIEDLETILTDRTRVVAVTKASNAVGTIVDLKPIAERIHARKGYLFVDAVHFAPHGPLDVRYLDCDLLVCSGYKIFGPHMGFLWGRREILDRLPTLREHFIPDRAPEKFEMGTFNYEAVAGMTAAIGYLEELGRRSRYIPLAAADDGGRRGDVRRGMQAIRHYERTLSEQFLRRAREAGAKVYGLDEPVQAADRTPTFCFTVEGVEPSEVTSRLAAKNVFVRDGHLYCPRLIRKLGLSVEPGAVRASLAHYNTFEEVDRFAVALGEIRS